MNRKAQYFYLAILFIVLFYETTTNAQSSIKKKNFSARLSGVVYNPEKIPAPNIQITIETKDYKNKINTNSEGSFFIKLIPGKYILTVDAKGYKRLIMTDITLKKLEKKTIILNLEFGLVNDEDLVPPQNISNY